VNCVISYSNVHDLPYVNGEKYLCNRIRHRLIQDCDIMNGGRKQLCEVIVRLKVLKIMFCNCKLFGVKGAYVVIMCK